MVSTQTHRIVSLANYPIRVSRDVTPIHLCPTGTFVLQERSTPLRQVLLLVINTHGLINYKDTKTKCRRLKILTCKGTLRQVPSFVNYCPLTFFLVHFPPPFPVLTKQYVGLGGGGEGCWVVLETIFCMSLTLCIWPDSEPTKLLDQPKQKPRRGGGLRQINTCRKVPTQVNYF